MGRKGLFLSVAGLLGGYTAIVATLVNKELRQMKAFTEEETISREVEAGRYNKAAYDALRKEEFSVPSGEGKIYGTHYVGDPDSRHVMVISHGVAVNKYNSIKYMNVFLALGFNVVLYDQRRHGLSDGKSITYGYQERHDLARVIQWTKERYDYDLKLGVHGESMGAATALLYAGTVEDGADFYIADCPYSDFAEQVAYRLKVQFHLPRQVFLPAAELIVRKLDGYRFRDVSPIHSVVNIEKPVLFISSLPDSYIPVQMTKDLYAKKQSGYKQLHLFEKGDHAMSLADNKQEYEQVVKHFLQEINIKAQPVG
ncbi:alpha/beta hydrolase [Terribacillus saccharophilus]|uniref:alpha/beta hydrolase n=1 Tax=Terribacillus saccharophilus TaxID=361277 RepID=UPI00298A0492|nr:alpha/beta hydrolase [Terribacillus saccharophilus]MCM3225546.1 alpha/beta hydrolase [Terribacillus saccharophilus]